MTSFAIKLVTLAVFSMALMGAPGHSSLCRKRS
jgi:hypothetical protein